MLPWRQTNTSPFFSISTRAHDRDLIEYLDGLPRWLRQEFARNALRDHLLVRQTLPRRRSSRNEAIGVTDLRRLGQPVGDRIQELFSAETDARGASGPSGIFRSGCKGSGNEHT